MQLSITYEDGSRKVIELTEDMVEGFDTSVAGTKTIVVAYGGQIAEFEITVTDFYVRALEIKDGYKSDYLRGDTYTDGDATLILHYTDASQKEIPLTKDMITFFDTSKLGKSEVAVSYEHQTTTYEIDVTKPTIESLTFSEDTEDLYFVGDEFQGLTADIVYENQTTGHVEITDVGQIRFFDTTAEGEKTLEFDYQDDTITMDYTVKKAVKSLALEAGTNLLYGKNEAFRPINVIVTNVDDTTETIALDETMVEGFDTSTTGKSHVTFEYGHQTLEFDVIVPLVNKVDYETSTDKSFRIEVEDEDYVDLSEVKTISTGDSNLEDAKGEGASGKCTSNIGSVAGNVIPIEFYSEFEGIFDLQINVQSASGKGGTDQLLSDVMTIAVNGEAVEVQGTAEKSGPGNWVMEKWNLADAVKGATLKKGLNRVEITTRDTVNSNTRLPNIDYFNIVVTSIAE